MVSEIVESITAENIAEIRELSCYKRVGFKISFPNSIPIQVNTVIITDAETSEILLENHNLVIPTGKTFTYDFFQDTYAVTN